LIAIKFEKTLRTSQKKRKLIERIDATALGHRDGFNSQDGECGYGRAEPERAMRDQQTPGIAPGLGGTERKKEKGNRVARSVAGGANRPQQLDSGLAER
jgi:hypothetical protein